MPLPPAVLPPIRTLKASWPMRGWSYDNRLECVASSFPSSFAPEARGLLDPLFPHVFSERTLKHASEAIRRVAERTGGVRSTQLVFGAPAVGHVTPYGLWWPWEEADTISLRIGLDGASIPS